MAQIIVEEDLINNSGYEENERGRQAIRRFFISGLNNVPAVLSQPESLILLCQKTVAGFPQIYDQHPISTSPYSTMFATEIRVEAVKDSKDQVKAIVTYSSNTVDSFGGPSGKVTVTSTSFKENLIMDSAYQPLRVYYAVPEAAVSDNNFIPVFGNVNTQKGKPVRANVNIDKLTSDKLLIFDKVSDICPLFFTVYPNQYLFNVNNAPFRSFPANTLLLREWSGEVIARGKWHHHIVMEFKRGYWINNRWTGWTQIAFYHNDYNLAIPSDIQWNGNTIFQGNGFTAWMPYSLIDFNKFTNQLGNDFVFPDPTR